MALTLSGPQGLHQALSRTILGKAVPLEKLIMATVAGGHVLLEDVPGVGKTTAAKALAAGLGAEFKRIQFTPDLLPYDLTGVDVFHPETQTFEFRHGPLFTQVVLADEINRATPKVQSALLEVMEEGQITVGGTTHMTSPFFLVLATQNPFDTEGTFPLPSAQLDRFFLKLSFGYPNSEAERRVWTEDPAHQTRTFDPAWNIAEILELRKQIPSVHVADSILDLVEEVISRTRNDHEVLLGLSPRAGVHLVRAVRTWALLKGRDYVVGQDFRDLAADVWAHRLELRDRTASSREYLLRRIEESMVRHET